MLGNGVLAASLAVLPVTLDVDNFSLSPASAWAGSGEAGDSGDAGESGDAGDSGDAGESGDSDQDSDSGSSGESASSDDGGENGESGYYGGKGRNTAIPSRFGQVVRSVVTGGRMEAYYSDGWKETIKSGSYRLKNRRNKTVIKRKARKSDYRRISRAIRNAIKN